MIEEQKQFFTKIYLNTYPTHHHNLVPTKTKFWNASFWCIFMKHLPSENENDFVISSKIFECFANGNNKPQKIEQ